MRVEHIAIYVADLEEEKRFFTEFFGAESNNGYHNSKTGFRSYFLTFGDGARLELMHRPDVKEPHDSLLYGCYGRATMLALEDRQ